MTPVPRRREQEAAWHPGRPYWLSKSRHRSEGSGSSVARHDLDRRGSCAWADHGVEIRAAAVLRPIGVVDAVVDRTVDRLELDFPCHAGGDDPSRLLPCRG